MTKEPTVFWPVNQGPVSKKELLYAFKNNNKEKKQENLNVPFSPIKTSNELRKAHSSLAFWVQTTPEEDNVLKKEQKFITTNKVKEYIEKWQQQWVSPNVMVKTLLQQGYTVQWLQEKIDQEMKKIKDNKPKKWLNIAGWIQSSLAETTEFLWQVTKPFWIDTLGDFWNQIRSVIGKKELSEDKIEELYDEYVLNLTPDNVDKNSKEFKLSKTITDVAQMVDIMFAGINAVKRLKKSHVIKNIANIKNMSFDDVVKKSWVKEIWENIKPYVYSNTKLKNIKGKWVGKVSEVWKRKTTTILPNQKGKDMIQTAIDIKMPLNTTAWQKEIFLENVISKEAESMRAAIWNKWNFAFNPKSIKSRVLKVDRPFAIEVSDSQIKAIKKAAIDVIDSVDKKNWLWLLDARQEFDRLMNNKISGLYTDPRKEWLKEYVMWIRDVMNEYLIEKAPQAKIRESLKLQSNVYDLLDNIRTYPADIWGNRLTRLQKKYPWTTKILRTAWGAAIWTVAGWATLRALGVFE